MEAGRNQHLLNLCELMYITKCYPCFLMEYKGPRFMIKQNTFKQLLGGKQDLTELGINDWKTLPSTNYNYKKLCTLTYAWIF